MHVDVWVNVLDPSCASSTCGWSLEFYPIENTKLQVLLGYNSPDHYPDSELAQSGQSLKPYLLSAKHSSRTLNFNIFCLTLDRTTNNARWMLSYRFFLSIRPRAYKTMALYTGKNPVYKTTVLYCTIFLVIGILVPNIQF